MTFPRLLLPVLISCAALPALLAAPGPQIKLLESHVAPGGILVLVAGKEGLAGLKVRLGEKRYAFFPHPADPAKRAAAFIPIPFDRTPGPGELTIEGGTAGAPIPFTVTPSGFPTVKVTIPKRLAEPSEADKARALREREEILKIHATAAPDPLWNTPFLFPVNSKITGTFGMKRMFNGTVQSVHKGLDLRAATGTPVHAPAAGIVRLGKDLFYGGNLVLLDHGCGLFTAYAHLSQIQVSVGQAVQTGQVMGLSGATGRVSAPHLHWDASIGGTGVDPLQLKRWTAVLCKP